MNLRNENYFGGIWVPGAGPELRSVSPSQPERTVWNGRQASANQVADAVQAARAAQPLWARRPLSERVEFCQRFAAKVRDRGNELAELISFETGKVRWDSRGEAATVAAKIAVSVEALQTRRDTSSFAMGDAAAVTRFHPHGVLGVLGPFNFPAHLPNGHMVPALLAGNTIVFKPSEQAPGVGSWLCQLWDEIGLPPGVVNLVQGEREVGQALGSHPQLDGILFTGSNAGGRALHRAWADHPEKILALEMGGNNPLVVYDVDRHQAAAYHTILSAFVTAGQRCTCARRLIVVDDGSTGDYLATLIERIKQLRIGFYFDEPEPFYGTLINERSGKHVRDAFAKLADSGGDVLVPMRVARDNGALLSPGLIDVTEMQKLADEEVFGPLLTLRRVADFDEAIQVANDTAYGLSAGLLSRRRENFERFVVDIRAGIVNWNRQTTGASGRLPFGGCGLSGNHRPAGYYSADYCSYPVASLEVAELAIPETKEPGLPW